MARRRHPDLWGACALPVFAIAVLLAVLLITTVFSLPKIAENDFGPPAPGLGRARLTLYSALIVFQEGALTKPVDSSGGEIKFKVSDGETVGSVTGRLYEAGLISNPGAFRTYLSYAGLDRSMQAGSYRLSPAMPPVDIAHTLQKPELADADLIILDGWRLEEVARAVANSGLNISKDEFLQAAHLRPEGYSFSGQLPDPPSLEGFLFPGEYILPRSTPVNAVIQTMLDQFEANVTQDMRQGFKRQGLTLYQAVTLASIVEREAMVDDEKPMIASVYLNRLAINMKLDADPTVQYALGYDSHEGTWWTNPLSLDDLQVDSPYNTYRNLGLPPGPISTPSLSSLKAVAFPAKTPYYYFRAACDGSNRHSFSQTYEEHLGKGCP